MATVRPRKMRVVMLLEVHLRQKAVAKARLLGTMSTLHRGVRRPVYLEVDAAGSAVFILGAAVTQQTVKVSKEAVLKNYVLPTRPLNRGPYIALHGFRKNHYSPVK